MHFNTQKLALRYVLISKKYLDMYKIMDLFALKNRATYMHQLHVNKIIS